MDNRTPDARNTVRALALALFLVAAWLFADSLVAPLGYPILRLVRHLAPAEAAIPLAATALLLAWSLRPRRARV